MRRILARIAISIALLLIAVITVLIAIGYFAFALYLWLDQYLVGPVAAVASGAIVLLFALVLMLIARAMMRGSRGRERDELPVATNAAETAAQLGTMFGEKAHGVVGVGASLVTALLAGFAFGFSPKLRGLLWYLIKKMT
jgi:hypothetical protein